MEPYLNIKSNIPDGEAHVMPDGRVYIYGSWDVFGKLWCSGKYRVLSSSDLKNWEESPVSFSLKDVPWAGKTEMPDCICKNGRYYLYFCMSDSSEGVAVGDSPTGPFRDAVRLPVSGIDPAVFIDDDGQACMSPIEFDENGSIREVRLG